MQEISPRLMSFEIGWPDLNLYTISLNPSPKFHVIIVRGECISSITEPSTDRVYSPPTKQQRQQAKPLYDFSMWMA